MKTILFASVATFVSAGLAFAQPVKQVAAPGTIVAHLNGYFQFSVGAYGSSNMGSDASGYKLNSYGTASDFRIYPGFDGQTLNGIWYGVQAELRTTSSNAGAGVNSNSTSTSGTSGLYIKRAYGYLGTKNDGFVRFGQTDSAFTLSQTGVVENFGDGAQLNSSSGPALMLPTLPGLFVYADTGRLYATNKIVYETPTFHTNYGEISAISGFEPNSNGLKMGYASTGSANGANANSVPGGDNARRRNSFDASLSYANHLGAVANKVSVAYLHGTPLGTTNGSYGAGAPYGYAPLSVFQGGVETRYAGLLVGANVKFGQLEDSYKFKPKGARDALGFIVGASYNIGPYTVGASYFNQQSSGKYIPGSTVYARTLSEYGAAVGGDYQLAKPISLFIQYDYGHQHQPSSKTAANTQEQAVAVGTTIKW